MTNIQISAIAGMRERITVIRKHLDLNQKDFAEKVGCHRNRISDIERGLREVPKRTIFALGTELNVNLNWFVLGIGSMFQDEDKIQSSQSATEPSEKIQRQIELLGKLIDEKEKLIGEKDQRISLLEKMSDRQ